jgi:hydrogenase maturation protease
MSLESVFAAVRELGGDVPRTVIVGCEPEVVAAGMGRSASVSRAVPAAVALVRELVTSTTEVIP